MLSSKGGFDMDSISDITGISINKMDYTETGSQHSGSFNSDNTDALLSISVQEFEGDESLLDSISQTGRNVGSYQSPNRIPTAKQQVNFAENVKTSTLPEEIFVHAQGLKTSHRLSSTNQNKCSVNLNESFVKHEQNKQFEQVYDSELKNSDIFKDDSSYMTRKFLSDSDIRTNARSSVIKHHSSFSSSVNLDESSFNQKEKHYSKQEGHIDHKGGYHNKLGPADQHSFDSHTYAQEKQPWAQNGVTQLTNLEKFGQSKTDHPHTGTKKVRNFNDHYGTIRSINDYHGTIRGIDDHHGTTRGINDQLGAMKDINYHHGTLIGAHHHQFMSGRENMRDAYGNGGTIRDISSESSGKLQGDIYGRRHESDRNLSTNSQKFVDDHAVSSISGSDRNGYNGSGTYDGEKKDGILENKDDSSANQSQTDEMLLGVKHDPETNELYDDKVREGADILSRVLGGDHNASFTSLSSRSSERNEKSKSSSFKEKENLTKQRSRDSSTVHSEPAKLPRSSSPKSKKERGLNTAISDENMTPYAPPTVKTIVDEAPRNQASDLKQLNCDIEEILSRKKIALHELQVLEESLQRNQDDMKSSESLVEQYRWQATQARSELMELEKRRSELQEECHSLDRSLQKSKQRETFNDNEVTFGRSKDEIFQALQERELLKQDLESMQETLKREQKKSKLAQDELRDKIRSLEEELRKQHEESVKNLQMMKEERNSHVEILQEKLKREINQWKRATENAEMRIKQLEESLFERNDELDKVRTHLREEKQKNLDIEKQWRSQLESERQDADIKHDSQERSWKDLEQELLQQQKELENLVEERTTDFRRSEERCKSQTEELQKIIENKNEEMKMVRGLVRQQEDATRVLGERLRNEAREHVRIAVEKERESVHKEKERIRRTVDEEKDKHERIVKQLTEQLDIEKERHLQTKEALNKMKQEGDELRRQVVDVHGERISSVQKARQESGEELEKIKEKLHEFTVQVDKLEKIDQETAKAIYEECRKIADMVDMPFIYKTPTRFSDEKPDRNNHDVRESPTKEALASLRHCNDELRQRLSDMRKQLAKQSTQTDQETSLSSVADNELNELRKRLVEKEEEIQRLQRKYNEEIQTLKEEKRKEQLSYRKTIAKLEQEFQKLVATKASSTPYKTKRETISRSANITSNGMAHTHSLALKPATRSVEKSSSADLLKHLQDRVKKLRAENENLKKTSDNESLVRNARNVKSLDNSQSSLSQTTKGLTISKLRTPSKDSALRNSIEEVSRTQKLLASSTKSVSLFGNTD